MKLFGNFSKKINFQKTNFCNILGAFCRLKQAAKPGYTLQFLDFANAKSAGFPLLSLALLTG